MPKGETGALIDSPNLRQALLDAIASGIPMTTAVLAAGLNHQIIWDWRYCAEHGQWRSGSTPSPEHLAIIREFVEQIPVALAKLESTLIGRIYTAGEQRNEKTGLLDWRPNAFVLNNHPAFREQWHPKQNTNTVVVAPRKRSELNDLSDAELIELAGDEWKEILTPRQLTEGTPDADSA